MNYWYKTKSDIESFVKDYKSDDKFVALIWAKDEIEKCSGKRIRNWRSYCRAVENDVAIYNADVGLENGLFDIARTHNKNKRRKK